MVLWQIIKEDWSYRLPERLKYNRYIGVNRTFYQFWCLVYYFIKMLILLLLMGYHYFFYYLFYGLYRLLGLFFEREKNDTQYDEYEDDEYEDDAYDEHEKDEAEATLEVDAEEIEFMDKKPKEQTENHVLKKLWYNGDENEWLYALEGYFALLKDEQREIEDYINSVDREEIKKLDACAFYDFLYHKYFVWKYTDKRRLATTRKNLQKYIEYDELSELGDIQNCLFAAPKENAELCLEIASEIRGLGTAGASGLLAILFPEHFGTVDQFVVRRLCEVGPPAYRKILNQINPVSIKNKDGAILEKIMREKAAELNTKFHTTFWTPRRIDMVLWAFGR